MCDGLKIVYECEQCGMFVEEGDCFLLIRKDQGQEYLCGGCLTGAKEKGSCEGNCEDCTCE